MNTNISPEEAADLGISPPSEPAGGEPQTSGAPESEETTDPPKRRRGRPSNAERAARAAGLNAETVGSSGASKSEAPKKRGPKPSGEKLATMARQLQGLHTLAAMATGLPELQISEQEAGMLATAFADVSAEYGLSVDGKTGAALQLFGAAAMIYAPRYLAINKRMKRESQSAPIVVDMPNVPPTNSAAH